MRGGGAVVHVGAVRVRVRDRQIAAAGARKAQDNIVVCFLFPLFFLRVFTKCLLVSNLRKKNLVDGGSNFIREKNFICGKFQGKRTC